MSTHLPTGMNIKIKASVYSQQKQKLAKVVYKLCGFDIFFFTVQYSRWRYNMAKTMTMP